MSKPTIVDLIRHGEPEGGLKFRGKQDDPLSTLGWAQLRGAVGDYAAWERIISSPLTRCAAFAKELADRHGKPLAIWPDFAELHFGSWEGRTGAEVNATDPVALVQFWRDPVAYPVPGGEPIGDFQQRVRGAWHALIEAYRGQHVLLVAHGGTIRMVLQDILEMPLHAFWRLEVPYAGISRVQVFPDPQSDPHVVFLNGRLT